MRSIFAFAILAAVMYVCGLGDTDRRDTGVSNAGPARSEPKQSKESLTAEFLGLARQMSDASVDGDITYLAKYTTDDFELTRVDGKVQNKNEALADVKKERTIRSYTLTDEEVLSFSDDSAVFRYTINITLRNGQSGRARITDSLVKKDGRWLIKSEQQTLIRK
jgi:hypothetical protein